MANNTSKVYEAPEMAGFQVALHGEAGTEAALFVINLCASIAPISAAGRNLPGLENYRLYQVSRMEDGRTRHRLRLGFFTSEAHAENVLALVRQQYPTAFTACLREEDRKFARDYLPPTDREAAAKPRPVVIPVAAPTTDQRPASDAPAAAEPDVVELILKPSRTDTPAEQRRANPANVPPGATGTAQAPAPAPRMPAAAAPAGSASPAMLELSFSDPPPVAPRDIGDPTQPFHVGRGIDIADTGIRLHIEPGEQPIPATTPASPPVPASRTIAHASDNAPRQTALPPITKLAAVTPLQTAGIRPATTRPMRRAPPELDSTQTIRALTLAELEDEGLEKWFAIQLAASEQPVNLDTMPHLDIFDAYRLYSVASTNAGKIVHSLRLGFFKEDVSAEAVSGYLKTFFSTPTVLRVSEAEYTRFKAPPTSARPAQSADIVALTPAQTPRSGIPTITMEVPTPDLGLPATGAFEPQATGQRAAAKLDTAKLDAANTGSFKSGIGASAPGQPVSRTARKGALPARQRPVPPRARTGMTGRYKAVAPRSLSEQLLEEARAVVLSESGIHKAPKTSSLLSRLVGKLTR